MILPIIDTSLNHEEDDQEIDEPQSDINPIRRSTRTCRPTDRLCLYVDAEEHELGDLVEPANYKAALLDPESDKWLNAMNAEMQSIRDNEVWELVDLSPNGKTVGHKMALQKEDQHGWSIDIRAIRILIAITAFYDYEICQMDVKTAFLNGYLNEERFYMENSKRGTIPMQEKLKLGKLQGASTPAEKQCMQNIPYASAVGSIMYDVRCTRPDIMFAQNMTSRFQQNPSKLHWTTVKNILKYLRNTKDMFLIYGGDMKRELRVSCYTDVGYLTDAADLKSQTGYVFVLNGAIAIAKDHGVTKGARHFRAKVHYLRETIEMGDVRIEKVDTDDNLADPFTKALAFPKHSELTKKIGMIPASSLM
ncbi:hypothetical protein Tco_1405702 [Tanacetum coccineum]